MRFTGQLGIGILLLGTTSNGWSQDYSHLPAAPFRSIISDPLPQSNGPVVMDPFIQPHFSPEIVPLEPMVTAWPNVAPSAPMGFSQESLVPSSSLPSSTVVGEVLSPMQSSQPATLAVPTLATPKVASETITAVRVPDSTDGRNALQPGQPLWEAVLDLVRQAAASDARADATREVMTAKESAFVTQYEVLEKQVSALRSSLENQELSQKLSREQHASLRSDLEKAIQELTNGRKELVTLTEKRSREQQANLRSELEKAMRELANGRKELIEVTEQRSREQQAIVRAEIEKARQEMINSHKQIGELAKSIISSKEEQQHATQQKKDVEQRISELANMLDRREEELKAARNEINSAKKELEKERDAAKSLRSEVEELKSEAKARSKRPKKPD